MGTRVEADEFLGGGPTDPIVDATILLAQVGRPLEQDRVPNLAAFHFDDVLLRPPAFPFKGCLPDIVFLHDTAIQAFAFLLLQRTRLGWVIGAPEACPFTGNVRCASSLWLGVLSKSTRKKNLD